MMSSSVTYCLWKILQHIFGCLFSPSMEIGVIYTLQREADKLASVNEPLVLLFLLP